MHGWQIVRQLSRIQRTLLESIEPNLRAQGLSTRLTFMLASVERHPYASDISRALGLPPPTVSRLLKRLEADGMVVREGESGDLRRYRFQLTGRGRQALAGGRKEMETQMELLLEKRMRSEQVEALLELLTVLGGTREPPAKGDDAPCQAGDRDRGLV